MEAGAQLTLSLEDDAEIILTTAEVARRLDVAANTIIEWIQAGDFPNAFKKNPRTRSAWQIPKSDLDAFIEKRRKARGFCYTVD